MGPEPSVLLAISQRNMWVKKEDHACTSSGPLLIRGSAGHTFPRVAGIRRFVRQCSRNNDNDWQWLGRARWRFDRCGMQRREIEARPVILLITFSEAVGFSFHGGERASGRGGGPYGEGTLTRLITQLIKGAGGRVSGRACLLVGTTCLPANLIVRKESEGGDEHVQRRQGGHGLTGLMGQREMVLCNQPGPCVPSHR